MWNQMNKGFFMWNCISANFNLIPSSKIDFWPFLNLQKMDLWQKKISWNWFIWFHEFYGPGPFSNFWPDSIFSNFKNGQKSIFELGISLKLPKIQFHEKKFLISRVYLYGLFKIFWPSVVQITKTRTFWGIITLFFAIFSIFCSTVLNNLIMFPI